MVQKAKDMGFTQFCLTEHMPRYEDRFLYPEELDSNITLEGLSDRFEKYLEHATAIQKREQEEGKIKILIGLEVEGIDEAHIQAVEKYRSRINMCVGSVHFVKGIPIDFDESNWRNAREACGGTTRALYREYFELQYKVLTLLKPEVIGHFDLIRLFKVEDEDPTTGKPIAEVNLQSDWLEVWELILRNIEFVVSYGGLFELNSAAIRKGWDLPYPRSDIGLLIKKLGGRFCLSDDSHAYAQVGLNYHKVWEYINSTLQLDKIYYLDLDSQGKTVVLEGDVLTLSESAFWNQYK